MGRPRRKGGLTVPDRKFKIYFTARKRAVTDPCGFSGS